MESFKSFSCKLMKLSILYRKLYSWFQIRTLKSWRSNAMPMKHGKSVQNRIISKLTKYHSFSANTSKVIKKTLVGWHIVPPPPRPYRVKSIISLRSTASPPPMCKNVGNTLVIDPSDSSDSFYKLCCANWKTVIRRLLTFLFSTA